MHAGRTGLMLCALLLALGACRGPRSPADVALDRCQPTEYGGYSKECSRTLEGLDAAGLRALREDEHGERILFYFAEGGLSTARAVALARPPSKALQRRTLASFDDADEDRGPDISLALLCRHGCDVLREGLERTLCKSMHRDFRKARYAAAALGFIGDARSRPALRLALRQRRSWPLSMVAAHALGRLAMPRADLRRDLALVATHWSRLVRHEAWRVVEDPGFQGYRALTRLVRRGDAIEPRFIEPFLRLAEPLPGTHTDMGCVKASLTGLSARVDSGPGRPAVVVGRRIAFHDSEAEIGPWHAKRLWDRLGDLVRSDSGAVARLPGHLVGAKVLPDGSLVAVASGGVVRVDRRGVWGVDCSAEGSPTAAPAASAPAPPGRAVRRRSQAPPHMPPVSRTLAPPRGRGYVGGHEG